MKNCSMFMFAQKLTIHNEWKNYLSFLKHHTMKKYLLILALTALVFTACEKDDDPTPITTVNLTATATSGNWRVTYYYDNNTDQTSKFAGYTFTFAANNVLTATKASTSVVGNWAAGTDDSKVKLIITFSTPADFAELTEDWHVLERTDTKIRMQHISGGNGGTDFLTFEKN